MPLASILHTATHWYDAAAVCDLSPLTSFKLDNGCNAAAPTNSYQGCWVPPHSSNAEITPGSPTGSSINGWWVPVPFTGRDVTPSTQKGQIGVKVRQPSTQQ